MSTEQGAGSTSEKAASRRSNPTHPSQPTRSHQSSKQYSKEHATPKKPGEETYAESDDRKPPAIRETLSTSTSPSTPDDPGSRPRQVIAVSASKGPAAFFNLARKFLVTDEMCDLSALEGAIVSAVDAAHLLERSKLATIVRVQTSYVNVEPKRRKRAPGAPHEGPMASPLAGTAQGHSAHPSEGEHQSQPGRGRASSGRELRRARIVITVKRTESYKQWLEENPLQAIIAGDGGDDEGVAEAGVEQGGDQEAS